MNNQRGVATLEVILVILIIAVLSTVTLPKAARMVDVAALDYEVRRFCSDFDFAHSLGRQSDINTEIFSNSIKADNSRFILIQIDNSGNSYQLCRKINSNNVALRDAHILSDGIKITPDKNSQILFTYDGRITNPSNGAISESFVFTSRNNEFYVSVDSVGRWRGKRERN